MTPAVESSIVTCGDIGRLRNVLEFRSNGCASSIIGRGLDESVKKRLAAQAKQRPNIGVALLEAARSAGGVDELPIPERSDEARSVDFG